MNGRNENLLVDVSMGRTILMSTCAMYVGTRRASRDMSREDAEDARTRRILSSMHLSVVCFGDRSSETDRELHTMKMYLYLVETYAHTHTDGIFRLIVFV